MLSFYNLGLMSEVPFDPNPQIRLFPKQPASSAYQESQEEEPEVSEVPASQRETSCQEERQQSDEEGNDTETSTLSLIHI